LPNAIDIVNANNVKETKGSAQHDIPELLIVFMEPQVTFDCSLVTFGKLTTEQLSLLTHSHLVIPAVVALTD
jgi:hypothetical protein